MGCSGLAKRLLDKINSPKDLKSLSNDELKTLAQEIREELIETVSQTGGHLAPNLGVVELTIGLHRALDAPKDKIVWDVGHQSYIHKILTGRLKQFKTLRQYGGIAGFPKRLESEYDVFDTGHAGNSISVALGLAVGRDMKKSDATIVAVIGDGSLTSGMSYEALNQAGHLGSRLIVILNDNEMSIAKNVGAMSSYLSRIRLDPAYNKLRDEVEERIRKIPGLGETLLNVGDHIKESIKAFIVPVGMLFEEMGFTYVGPINGHDIQQVVANVAMAKELKGPVLIHVLTRKGYGYAPAEDFPDKFHGVAPYRVETGEARTKGSIPSYTDIFGEAMVELGKKNKKILAITAAMPAGTGLDNFARAYPKRFFDVGIAEQHAVTFAAGLALKGFIPVVAIYSTFLERSFDQLIQDICLQNLHVVFALDRGGLVGEDGPTHHGVFDLSYLRQIPNMVVMAPKNEVELRDMLYTAIELDGPVAFRYPRGTGWGLEYGHSFKKLQVGRGEVLREGQQVCLLAVGRMVRVAEQAAEMLSDRGIIPTVINARFVKPLDEELILSQGAKHSLMVTIEENTVIGGFGSAVLELLARNNVFIPVLQIGLPDRFITHGTPEILLKDVGLDAAGVVNEIEAKLAALSAHSEVKSIGFLSRLRSVTQQVINGRKT